MQPIRTHSVFRARPLPGPMSSSPHRTPDLAKQWTRLRCCLALLASLLLPPLLSGCTTHEVRADTASATLADDRLTGDAAEPAILAVRGHALAVLERGDPQGFPVFYAHGNPGSRRELVFLHRMAVRHGLRLIAFDRPGFGESPLVAPYSLRDFADDVAALAEQKGIARFGLIGWSSGAPPVIATAHYHPRQVAFTFAVAGYTDFSTYPDAVELMRSRGFPGADWSENRPILFNSVVSVIRWADLNLPGRYLDALRKELPPADLAVLDPPAAADLFVRIQQDAVKQGTEGPVQDLRTQWRAWGFPLRDVTSPVAILQGSEDPFIPAEFPRHLASTLGNARFLEIPGRGHLMPLQDDFQQCLFGAASQWLAGASMVLPQWPGCVDSP